MSTYSIGTPPTDALKLQDLNTVLGVLPDNTSKLISPKDVRDAVYTLWENIMFKPTSNSGGTEYIGIDKPDFQEKILIGKKTVGGAPVLTNNLLSTNFDVFFYNTRTEPQADYDTRVAFLAGTGSNYQAGQLSAPYLKSTVVTNPGYSNTLDFEIRNSSYYSIGLTNYGGNISVYSDNGYVFLNGVRWPTYVENTVGISQQDYVLKYKWIAGQPSAVWEAVATASIQNNLFSTGTVSITGSPVILNGLPINFSSNIPTPTTIGGILAGSTFSNVPVTEMIRQILYPYIAPDVTSSLNYQFVEMGDSNTAANLLEFSFTVYKNATYSISTINYTPPPANFLVPPAPGIIPANIPNGLNTYIIRPILTTTTFAGTTQSFANYDFNVSLSDTFPTNIGSTSSLSVVIPWYYGTATVSATQSFGVGNINNILGNSYTPTIGKLTPLLTAPALSATSSYNKTVDLSTAGLISPNQGYIYFGYPANFPDLQTIVDPNGFDVTGSFLKFTISNVISPNGWWLNKNYKFYIFVGSATGASAPLATTIGTPPLYQGSYQFKFA